jgi:hypothetical protein
MPTTIARSPSTKAATNSIMAFGIGHMTINSQIPSITHIATTPTTPKAMRSPPGPDTARTLPLVVANPIPIVPPIAINYAKSAIMSKVERLWGCSPKSAMCLALP